MPQWIINSSYEWLNEQLVDVHPLKTSELLGFRNINCHNVQWRGAYFGNMPYSSCITFSFRLWALVLKEPNSFSCCIYWWGWNVICHHHRLPISCTMGVIVNSAIEKHSTNTTKWVEGKTNFQSKLVLHYFQPWALVLENIEQFGHLVHWIGSKGPTIKMGQWLIV
jgi:hypothetical protein